VSSALLPIVCAWCERVRTGSGVWEEPGDGASPAEEATHGICPECLVAQTREVSAGLEWR
jgi:hypothetical protein